MFKRIEEISIYYLPISLNVAGDRETQHSKHGNFGIFWQGQLYSRISLHPTII